MAILRYLEARAPTQGEALAEFDQTQDAYRRLVKVHIERHGLRAWHFWRTIPVKQFQANRSRLFVPEVSDPGRALVLSWGFRALGGIAPFLILWLAALMSLPLLFWAAWEFFAADRPIAGTVFLLWFVSSPFVVESLSLSRSAVGFYLVGLLAAVILTVYARLGRDTSRSLFLLRFAFGGLVFGVCILCRSGCLFLLPLVVLLCWMASRRICPVESRRRWVLFASGVLLLILPSILLRQPQHHDAWQSLWEGLGDFDRSKSHYWSDAKALEFVASRGGTEIRSRDAERILRDDVLRHIREDPMWYAGILGKRLLATVSLSRLSPWGPRDGVSLTRASAPNEGSIDKYYRYTTPVDFLAIGARKIELPIIVLMMPSILLLVWWIAIPRAGRPVVAPSRQGLDLQALVALALATLPVPVLISTGGAQETQCFAVVYFLGGAFLFEEIVRRLAKDSAASA